MPPMLSITWLPFVLHGLLSTSQFIGIITVLGSAVVFVLLRRRRREAPEV